MNKNHLKSLLKMPTPGLQPQMFRFRRFWFLTSNPNHSDEGHPKVSL